MRECVRGVHLRTRWTDTATQTDLSSHKQGKRGREERRERRVIKESACKSVRGRGEKIALGREEMKSMSEELQRRGKKKKVQIREEKVLNKTNERTRVKIKNTSINKNNNKN